MVTTESSIPANMECPWCESSFRPWSHYLGGSQNWYPFVIKDKKMVVNYHCKQQAKEYDLLSTS